MESLARALAIEGQMSHVELAWLATCALTHTHIVELGSFFGRSTRALADHTSGVVLAVDDWFGPRETSLSPDERRQIAGKFCINLADHLASGRVIMVTWDHHEINRLQPDAPPDMVFLDGDHHYASVRRDIRWARQQFLRRGGGLVCGHDIERFEVADAVSAEIDGWQRGPGTLWWANFAAYYGARPRG